MKVSRAASAAFCGTDRRWSLVRTAQNNTPCSRKLRTQPESENTARRPFAHLVQERRLAAVAELVASYAKQHNALSLPLKSAINISSDRCASRGKLANFQPFGAKIECQAAVTKQFISHYVTGSKLFYFNLWS